MLRTGTANLPLHPGKCPPWLFGRMIKLSKAITEIIVNEYGQEEFLRRIADPYFFQSFACTVGFDWHSSGTTTTLCGALKEALNKEELGIRIAGGKGKASRETPEHIERFSNSLSISTQKMEHLKYASKITAKVDNNLIQDGYQLYMHAFFFTEKGRYAVVQQGLCNDNSYARRYHWLSDNVRTFIEEPHNAICCDKKEENVLDLTSKQSKDTRDTSLDLVKDNPKHLEKYFNPKGQKTLFEYSHLTMAPDHYCLNLSKRSLKFLKQAYEFQPKNYEELVALKNMGPQTIRALALISELVYGTKSSWKDPARFSFSHGGKDGVPHPVDRELMDNNTEFLKEALRQSKLGDEEKLKAVKRLKDFVT
ncbi:DUF763 domain-containing protein [Candidatus Woesearchaeota archaeon]|nr:DUF763 domain-containing protein [Candidatus Woesearchaeota archaeon]